MNIIGNVLFMVSTQAGEQLQSPGSRWAQVALLCESGGSVVILGNGGWIQTDVMNEREQIIGKILEVFSVVSDNVMWSCWAVVRAAVVSRLWNMKVVDKSGDTYSSGGGLKYLNKYILIQTGLHILQGFL